MVNLPPDIAVRTAKELGDISLPNEPDLQNAYLSDPKLNTTYASEAVNLLTRDYNGDTGAAIVALAFLAAHTGLRLAR